MSDREEFEKWYDKTTNCNYGVAYYVDITGRYCFPDIEIAWQAWQAFSVELAENAKRNLDAKDDEIDRLKAQLKETEEKGRVLMDMCRDLQARVTKLSEALQVSQQGSVPEGWKLVPVEPTTEMRYAYHEAHQRYLEGSIPSPDGQWWAMLDAAPQPERGDDNGN